jgi:integrase
MSEAKQQYLDVKGIGRTDKFEATCNRCIGYLFDVVNDKPLGEYTASDAIAFRDSLARKGLSPVTIKKVFATVKAVHNFATKENGLDITNPFTGVHIETAHYQVIKRQPIHEHDIKLVQSECFAINDELRLLVALISDSGMRLAEAAGLMISDIVLDDEVPHVVVKPYKHRRLKTKCSERLIPLVGSSLKAAKIIVNKSSGDYCFPRYSSASKCNAGSASASINKWLKNITNKDVVCHGFRHSLRDRLRAADVGIELIDEIGGWSRQSIGAQYGNGYSLEKKQEALIKMLQLGGD